MSLAILVKESNWGGGFLRLTMPFKVGSATVTLVLQDKERLVAFSKKPLVGRWPLAGQSQGESLVGLQTVQPAAVRMAVMWVSHEGEDR